MVYLRFVHACTSVNLIIQYDKIYESAVLWFADLILTARSSNNAHAKQTHQLATSEYPKCPDKYQGCKMFITKTVEWNNERTVGIRRKLSTWRDLQRCVRAQLVKDHRAIGELSFKQAIRGNETMFRCSLLHCGDWKFLEKRDTRARLLMQETSWHWRQYVSICLETATS